MSTKRLQEKIKKIGKVFAILFAIILAVAVPGNTAGAETVPSLATKTLSITKGSTQTISIKRNGTKINTVSWKSSQTSVVTVKKKDKLKAYIKANKGGVATITTTVSYKKGKKLRSKTLVCKVIVKENSTFAGGNGTKEAPFQIATLNQLKNVSKYNGCYFVQTQDIDADYGFIDPLFPSDENPFTGVYDGGGCSILNYNYNDKNAERISIFGQIGEKGRIKKLTIKDSYVTARDAAVLAYQNYGIISNCEITNTSLLTRWGSCSLLCVDNFGKIENCSAGGEITYNVGTPSGTFSIGGICGYNTGNVFGCKASCDVKCEVTTSGYHYGGICVGGIIGQNKGMVKECSSEVDFDVYLDKWLHTRTVGGVVGLNDGQVIACTDSETDRDIVGGGGGIVK